MLTLFNDDLFYEHNERIWKEPFIFQTDFYKNTTTRNQIILLIMILYLYRTLREANNTT